MFGVSERNSIDTSLEITIVPKYLFFCSSSLGYIMTNLGVSMGFFQYFCVRSSFCYINALENYIACVCNFYWSTITENYYSKFNRLLKKQEIRFFFKPNDKRSFSMECSRWTSWDWAASKVVTVKLSSQFINQINVIGFV